MYNRHCQISLPFGASIGVESHVAVGDIVIEDGACLHVSRLKCPIDNRNFDRVYFL